MDIRVYKHNSIPSDSVAKITTGGLVGENYIEITAGKSSRLIKPGEQLATTSGARFEDLMENGEALLVELRKAATRINRILSEKQILQSARDAIKSVNQTARHASMLIASIQSLVEDASPQIKRSLDNISEATDRALALGNQLQDMLSKECSARC